MKKKKKDFLEETLSASAEKEGETLPREEEQDGDKTPASGVRESENARSDEEKMEEDIALFHELFPELTGKEIPDEVWARVEAGESLAAAFCLYTVKKMKEDEKIRKVNESNEKKAPPRVRQDESSSEYFSPEAVKAMSRSEIKKHYDAILRSMESWN